VFFFLWHRVVIDFVLICRRSYVSYMVCIYCLNIRVYNVYIVFVLTCLYIVRASDGSYLGIFLLREI
jgi:hypothetical protein